MVLASQFNSFLHPVTVLTILPLAVAGAILMTTVATMMSAVPPILGLGPGTETRSPMAAAVLGGLPLSTILSLIVVPSFCVVVDRAKRRLGSFVFRKKPETAAQIAE